MMLAGSCTLLSFSWSRFPCSSCTLLLVHGRDYACARRSSLRTTELFRRNNHAFLPLSIILFVVYLFTISSASPTNAGRPPSGQRRDTDEEGRRRCFGLRGLLGLEELLGAAALDEGAELVSRDVVARETGLLDDGLDVVAREGVEAGAEGGEGGVELGDGDFSVAARVELPEGRVQRVAQRFVGQEEPHDPHGRVRQRRPLHERAELAQAHVVPRKVAHFLLDERLEGAAECPQTAPQLLRRQLPVRRRVEGRERRRQIVAFVFVQLQQPAQARRRSRNRRSPCRRRWRSSRRRRSRRRQANFLDVVVVAVDVVFLLRVFFLGASGRVVRDLLSDLDVFGLDHLDFLLFVVVALRFVFFHLFERF
mmetsp:Transcript_13034/g.39384  ORF Transcript_13034/g.39384 Transcript_13034/m.39384 type:complete len:366 (+) Transcript_13034:288-1385(+)